jgi:phospholipid/cholesterol/gamma-HCH transport system ATP-binding protein
MSGEMEHRAEEATAPGEGVKARHEGEVAIRVEDLHKSFGDNYVLRGIDLDFPVGTTTVILGGSGSGKSVLMKHLIGLLKPDKGRVIVEGQDLAQLTSKDMNTFRMKFGMVFQWAALFDSMTVYENISFPLREHKRDMPEEEIKQKVREKLELFGIEGTEEKFPADLSGGMRKRVGLARAIIMEPRIVLYDEPTTGLDPITTASVDDMIKRAKDRLGVTSVVISHDIGSAVNIADYIAFLYGGQIVSYGAPSHVRQSQHPFVAEFMATWFSRN